MAALGPYLPPANHPLELVSSCPLHGGERGSADTHNPPHSPFSTQPAAHMHVTFSDPAKILVCNTLHITGEREKFHVS